MLRVGFDPRGRGRGRWNEGGGGGKGRGSVERSGAVTERVRAAFELNRDMGGEERRFINRGGGGRWGEARVL